MFKLMRRPEVHPVNTGNPIEYAVKEVAALILKLSGRASELMHKPLPQVDPKQRCAEITRSHEVSSAIQETSLEKGSREP